MKKKITSWKQEPIWNDFRYSPSRIECPDEMKWNQNYPPYLSKFYAFIIFSKDF